MQFWAGFARNSGLRKCKNLLMLRRKQDFGKIVIREEPSASAFPNKFYCKGLKELIQITKDESTRIRAVYPRAEIARTCRGKSNQHRYFLPEEEKYLRLIADTNEDAARICGELDKEKSRRQKYAELRRNGT